MRETDRRFGAQVGVTGLVGSAGLAAAATAMLAAGVVLQRAFDPAAGAAVPLSWMLWLTGALLAVGGGLVLAVAAGGLVGGVACVGVVRLAARVRASAADERG